MKSQSFIVLLDHYHSTNHLSDNARENRAKVRKGDMFDLDGPSMDGTHYPRYLQGQKGFGL